MSHSVNRIAFVLVLFSVLLLSFVLLPAVPCVAQTSPGLEQGFKPYGSYHGGDIDTVNLLTGNLTLNVPLLSYPQRGKLALQFFLVYNNASWQVKQTIAGNPPKPKLDWVWRGQGVTADWNGDWGVSPEDLEATSFTPGVVTDPFGGTHIYSFVGSGPSTKKESLDATGLMVIGSSVTDRSGITYGNQGGFNSGMTDPNGNQITRVLTWDSTNFVFVDHGWIDSVGRQIPGGTFHQSGRSRTWVPGVATADLSGCPAGTGTASVWDVPAFGGGTSRFKFCYALMTFTSNFGLSYIQEHSVGANVLTAVILPNSTQWTFSYDGQGNLSQIGYPTGGKTSYGWVNRLAFGDGSLGPRVNTRSVDANDGKVPSTWSYSYNISPNGDTKVTDPANKDTVHSFSGMSGSVYETETKFYDGPQSGGVLLKTIDTHYTSIANPNDNVAANIFADQITTTFPNGHVTKTVRTSDSGATFYSQLTNSTYPLIYGNVVNEAEYDFGQSSPTKQTVITPEWQTDSNYLNANLLDLPASITINDGSGNKCAETDYAYDDPNRLVGASISTQHVGPPNGVRGNLSSMTHLLSNTPCQANASWSTINSYANVYDTGEVYQSIDPLSRTTTYSYDPAFVGGRVTNTQLPDTSSNGTTTHHIISANYDFNIGVLTSFTDQNRNSTSYSYDNMGRITNVTGPQDPNNGGQQALTTLTYNDAIGNNSPSAQRQERTVDSNTLTTSWTQFDGLGRTIRTAKTNGEAGANSVDDVDTCYDSLGRKSFQSYPYKSSGFNVQYACNNSQRPGDTFSYDALGALTTTTRADGGTEQSDFSSFPMVTVTDETNRQRRSTSDAFGRLIEVDEPGGLPATAASGSLTINGTLRNFGTGTQPATSGHVELTFSGTLQSKASCSPSGQPCSDSGSISITVAGFTKSVNYSSSTGTDSGQSVHALANAFHLDSTSPVDAIFYGADESGNIVVDLIARTKGAATNYPLSTSIVSNDPTDFPSPSFQVTSGSHLIGGQDASNGGTIYDSGIVYVAMYGFTASASYGQNGNNTAALIASALVGTGATGLNQPNSPVTASASGSTITMTYKTLGASGNISVSLPSSSYQPDNPSFTTPGVMLSGGSDPQPPSLLTPAITLYSYDALGNLVGVQQQGNSSDSNQWRPRSFQFDSLSRLLTATNPESGTICYGVWQNNQCVNGYDNNSNLIAKTTPAPNQTGTATVTAAYGYDALNRLTGTTFSSGGGAVYVYDQSNLWSVPIRNGIGRLSGEYNTLASDSHQVGFVNSYDVMGRLVYQNEFNQRNGQPNQVNKVFSYAYNLDGTLKSVTYPSTRVVNYSYNTGQRPVSAADSANNYASSAQYTAFGALSSLVNGGIITTTNSFNARMQPVFLSAATSGQTVLSLGYDFNSCNGNGGDNGNVCQLTNNKNSSRSQTFQYDSLNRLLSANSGNWSQSYTYDPWGNLLKKTVSGGDTPLNVSVNGKNQATNWCYDSAGNIVGASGCPSFTNVYDAENRLLNTAAGIAYDYDADGWRVKKSSGTLYWYGPSGEVLDETDLNGVLQNEYIFFGGKRMARLDSSGAVHYYFSDHLGSADVITNANGSVIEEESDYYPFGGERVVAGPGPNHYKFTSKERDPETGCDFFGARYYCNSIGRFLIADWAAAPAAVPYAHFGNPQSLNLYSYVENNPTTFGDPDGHLIYIGPKGGGSGSGGTRSSDDDWIWNQFAQELQNWWGYGRFRTNYAFHFDAESARQELQGRAVYDLKTKTVTIYTKEALAKMSDADVLKLQETLQKVPMANEEQVKEINEALKAIPIPVPVPELDASGKVHTKPGEKLPDHVPDKWTKEDLEHAAQNLRESIKRRKQELIDLGEDAAHRKRVGEEEQLLRQIEKKLSGS